MVTLDEIQPMLAPSKAVPPFSSPEWAYEIKFDGFRCLAEWGPEGARLKSREGTDMTRWFPEVGKALAAIGGRRCIVDGEIAILNDHGIAGNEEFDRLARRAARRGKIGSDPVVYCVFDVLVVGGRNLMRRPLLERKRHIPALLDGVPNTLPVGHIVGEGEAMYRAVLDLRLEGLVAKRLDSTYQMGRTTDWLKIKRPGAVPAERFRHR